MAGLGVCQRCARRPATTTTKLPVGDTTYDVRLCDEDTQRLMWDLLPWTRLGQVVDDGPAPWRPAAWRTGEPVRLRPARPPAAVPDDWEPPDLTRVVAEQLPPAADRWKMSGPEWHAGGRAAERGVTRAEALWAACEPDMILPSKHGDGSEIRIRGDVAVVVLPAEHVIKTVLPPVERVGAAAR